MEASGMELRLSPAGQLEKDFGAGSIVAEIPENSTLKELLGWIDAQFGKRLPAETWNRGEQRFRGPVVLVSDGRILSDPGTTLRAGQEILLFKVLVGG